MADNGVHCRVSWPSCLPEEGLEFGGWSVNVIRPEDGGTDEVVVEELLSVLNRPSDGPSFRVDRLEIVDAWERWGIHVRVGVGVSLVEVDWWGFRTGSIMAVGLSSGRVGWGRDWLS